jgi:hypothetical protein
MPSRSDEVRPEDWPLQRTDDKFLTCQSRSGPDGEPHSKDYSGQLVVSGREAMEVLALAV